MELWIKVYHLWDLRKYNLVLCFIYNVTVLVESAASHQLTLLLCCSPSAPPRSLLENSPRNWNGKVLKAEMAASNDQ